MDTPAGKTSRRAAVGLTSLVAGYLFLELVAGAPDSPLVPGLPAGVGVPGWTIRGARWLGLDGFTRTQLTVVAIAAVTILLAVFAMVAIEARSGRVSVRVAVAASAVSLGLAVSGPILLSRDATSYAAYGRIEAVHHQNPYAVPPSRFPTDPFVRAASPQWVDDTTVYGPLFTLASAAVARAWRDSPEATLAAFRAIGGLAALGATALAAMAARRWGWPDRAAMAALIVGVNPVIVIHTVGGGHNDALVALGLAGAMVVAARWWPGARSMAASLVVTVILTLAILVKSVAGVTLFVWWWQLARTTPSRRRVRDLAVHVGVALAIAAAAFAPFLSTARSIWSLVAAASREGWASGPGLVARGAKALGRAFDGQVTADVLAAIVVAAFLAVFVLMMARIIRHRSSPGRLPDLWGASMLLFALTIPYLLPWYAAWFLPLVVLVRDERLGLIGLVAAGLLALTGIPAEAGSAPAPWHAMVLAVHFLIAPVMLALWAGASVLAGRRTIDRPS